uniref:Thaumatin-like protein n=1 Tax=Glycine max TaxID=3847 RepID=K7K481_SOYBN
MSAGNSVFHLISIYRMAFVVTMATTCNVRMGNSTKMASIVTMASLFFFQFLSGSCSTRLTITNKCSYTVWPAILSATGSSPLSTSGFVLQPGDFKIVPVPPAWSGRLWGRTLCSLDITSTKFSCVTGDCGSTTIECVGGNATPPVTLVKFTLNGTGGLDFYEVSLVDGFNLPVRVEPRGGRNRRATGCEMDLNLSCPTELKVIRDGDAVACKSSCQAEPCLTSQFFKTACPGAHVHTCSSHDYTITFCPPPTPSSR